MRFPGIRLVAQTEQKSLRVCLKKKTKITSDCNSRALFSIKAPIKSKKIYQTLDTRNLLLAYSIGRSTTHVFVCD